MVQILRNYIIKVFEPHILIAILFFCLFCTYLLIMALQKCRFYMFKQNNFAIFYFVFPKQCKHKAILYICEIRKGKSTIFDFKTSINFMFFYLSKTLPILTMPITWLVVLMLWAWLTKSVKRRKKLLGISLVLVVILTNPLLVNILFLKWEIPATPFDKVKNYDVGVVLTGFAQESRYPQDRVYLNQAADRVVHTIKLYKEKKIKYILICGAEYDLANKGKTTYKSAREIFTYAGIPDSVIFAEPHSRNTRENALFGKAFLDSKFPKQKYLIITSAYHIRRAKGCFEKVGLKADTFSVDFWSTNTYFSIPLCLPSEDAFTKWSKFIHEIVGYCVYSLVGYC